MNFIVPYVQAGWKTRNLVLVKYLLIINFVVAIPQTIHASTAFTYDSSGGQLSQQTATAAAPVIVGQLSNQLVVPGGAAGFSVFVNSQLPVTYQWKFNGTVISGAVNDSLRIANAQAANEGTYSVTVTNTSGSVASTAQLLIDSNLNGLPDSWELHYFGNLNQTSSGDYSGDGITNLNKYLFGLNPTIKTPWLWISTIGGDFNDPANWNYQRTRSPGPGDTCTISTGTYSLSSQVTAGRVTVNVPFTAPANSDYTLNTTGAWTYNGAFTLGKGHQFNATGGGGITVAGTTTFNGGNLYVYGTGTRLTFSKVTSYTPPPNTNVSWTAGDGNGASQINFPALVKITGNVGTKNNSYSSLSVTAQYGGVINFPVLTTVTVPQGVRGSNVSDSIYFSVDSGTIISPALTSFTDYSPQPQSTVTIQETGGINLSHVTDLTGISLYLYAPGSLTIPVSSPLTALIAAASGAKVSFPNLTNIDAVPYLNVYDSGTTLSFPAVTSFTASGSTTWSANSSGQLIFSALKTISTVVSTDSKSASLSIQTWSGATTNLAALTTISVPATNTTNSHGVALSVSNSGTINAPLLTSFADASVTNHSSSLTALDTGILTLTKLTSTSGVDLDVNALSKPQSLTSITGNVSFNLNSGIVSMALSNLSGLTSISVSGTGTRLSFPSVTSYTQPANTAVSWQAGDPSYDNTGCQLNFTALQTITGSIQTKDNLDGTMAITAQDKALINFPALTTITEPTGTSGDNSTDGIQLSAFDFGTISAALLTTFTDGSDQPQSLLTSHDSGVLTMPKLASLSGISIGITSIPVLQQFTSLSNIALHISSGSVSIPASGSLTGAITVDGGAQVTFPNITSVEGLGSINVSGTNSKLTFSKVASFTTPPSTTIFWTAGQDNIDNTGCTLSFPALKTIDTEVSEDFYEESGLSVTAQDGAAVSLAALTTITVPPNDTLYYDDESGVHLIAENAGKLSAPLLTSFTDQTTDGHYSSILGSSLSTLTLTKLTSISGVNLDFNDLSKPQLLKSITGGVSFNLNSGTVAMLLTDISGLTTISVSGTASNLSFPSLTSYTQPPDTYVSWTAGDSSVDNTSCQLNFPALTSITGRVETNQGIDAAFAISAVYGATLNFANLKTISVPSGVRGYQSNDGILIDCIYGQINANALTSFRDTSNSPLSEITDYNNGISVSKLTQTGVTGVSLNGVTVP